MSVFTDKWIDEHKDELVEKLQQCVRINSVRDDGSTREGAPFGEGAAKCLEDTLNTAKEMGFEVKNLDGYCGTVDYGTGEEQLGILAHLDVVPEGEGWTYPPYAAEIHDGRLYGRGTMDDKGPAFAALFGLAAVKASGVETKRRVRLILGCDEECGMGCLHHYNEVEKAPGYVLLSRCKLSAGKFRKDDIQQRLSQGIRFLRARKGRHGIQRRTRQGGSFRPRKRG